MYAAWFLYQLTNRTMMYRLASLLDDSEGRYMLKGGIKDLWKKCNKYHAAPYSFLKSEKNSNFNFKNYLPIDISEKNETKVIHWITLSRHQVLSIDKVLRLLLWQQWRNKMAENVHFIQFISQTNPVTPDFFSIKTFLHL